MNILCFFKLHKWEMFIMSETYQKLFPEKSHIGRICNRCNKLEYLNDNNKSKWDRASRGRFRYM